jgi:hypothetical protein
MVLGGCFELYKRPLWCYFLLLKYVSLIGGECSVPENTVFFIQKFTKVKPLHDAADRRPTHVSLYKAVKIIFRVKNAKGGRN